MRDSATVTVANNPSGTLATMIPIANIRLVTTVYPMINPNEKKINPVIMATVAMRRMKKLISFLKGVSPELEAYTRPAI